MSNEKITKEKLLEKLGGVALSDDDLEKVTGGRIGDCITSVTVDLNNCISFALNEYNNGLISYNDYWQEYDKCHTDYEAGYTACFQ